MRVHEDEVIRRRTNVSELGDYSDARPFLEEDFHYMCGYCGKNQNVMHQKFQIDHFVPKSLDKDREKDYSNLVLACRKCNLAKSNKWPTADITKPNDGEVGFVDPATEEFDKHLERNEQGYIVPKTSVGKYMCEALHFDIRRTDIYWKCTKLKRQLRKMEKIFKCGELTPDEKDIYINMSILFQKYIDEAFQKGE